MPAAADCCACGCVSLRSSSKTERQKYMSFNSLWGSGVVKRESYLTTPDWPGVFGWLHVLSFCLRVKWLLTGYRINAHHRSYSGAVPFRCALHQRQKDKNTCLTRLSGAPVSRNASRISQHRPSQGSLVGPRSCLFVLAASPHTVKAGCSE